MQLPPETVYAQTLYQIGALATIARAQGGVMRHVKPHGMLYNQRRKKHNWQTPSPERYTLAIQHWFSLGWQEAS